ncbi:MAG: peptide chain release factor 2 [Candidatus Altimarinota bacterium]
MYEHKQKLETIATEVSNALQKIDLQQLKNRIIECNILSQEQDFWNDQENAQKITKEQAALQKEVESWEKIKAEVEELQALGPTIKIEEDPDSAQDYKNMIDNLEINWRKLETKTFLNGKYDSNNAILSIHAGTGGKDAMDFAEILLRMYIRYAEHNDYTVEIMEKSAGEEVGLKSATILISGYMAYGYLKCEKGVHRLVRNSPFNAKNSRETSFALVEVMPDVDISHHAQINKDDLRIDTFRAGGAGGQNVNKVSSSVRITHLPTNLVAACQTERSQLQNKERAMKILIGKLTELAEKQQVAELNQLKGEPVQMSWGNQMRSYVFHPYTMVKDHRTNHEERDVNKVLDGEIDGFIEAELKS